MSSKLKLMPTWNFYTWVCVNLKFSQMSAGRNYISNTEVQNRVVLLRENSNYLSTLLTTHVFDYVDYVFKTMWSFYNPPVPGCPGRGNLTCLILWSSATGGRTGGVFKELDIRRLASERRCVTGAVCSWSQNM